MPAKPLPSVEYLRQCFSYDPETGTLTWRERPRDHFRRDNSWRNFNNRFVGKPAGTPHARPDGNGYCVRIKLNDRGILAHRIAWTIIHGAEPEELIDHRDGNGLNNRLSNLRKASPAQNCRNSKAKAPRHLKGTSFRESTNRWLSRIRVNGRARFLGSFATEAEAHAAYCRAAAELHGEFANFGRAP